jgi:iron complex outermembrane receptor protein
VYYYDYESIHTFTEEACPPGDSPGDTPEDLQSACAVVNSTASVQAAPGAEVWGLEFDALWLVTDNLTLGGNFSYTDTEYSETFFVVDGADPTIAGAVYTGQNNPNRVRDLKGNPLPRIPEWKASAYAAYQWPLGDNGTFDVMGTYSWIDDVYFSAFEDELDRAPEYQRVDLRATWTSASETWIVSGFVNNVFDEIGIRQILRHGSADGYRRTAQVSEPRLYGVELTYNLGR